MKLHIMKEGDTLVSLSQRYGVSLQQISETNNNLVHLETIPAGTKVKIPASILSSQEIQTIETAVQPTTNAVEIPYNPIIEHTVGGHVPFTYPLPQWSRYSGSFSYSPTYTFYSTPMSPSPCDCPETRSQAIRPPLPYAMPLVTQARANLTQMSGTEVSSSPMEVVDSSESMDSISADPPPVQDEQAELAEISDQLKKPPKIIRKTRRVSRVEQVRKLIKRSYKYPSLARHGHSTPWIRD
jgi:LysM repeat protein